MFRPTHLAYTVPLLSALIAAPIRAQSGTPSLPLRVSLRLDTARVARFNVRAFDLGVAQSAAAARSASAGDAHDAPKPSSAQIQLVKQAGAFTGELIRLSASGQHIDSGTIEVVDSVGAPTLTIRLTDIAIISDHLASSTARESLEQQRISLDEALAQLTSDYDGAARDLATAEELGKSRVTTKVELTRARAHVAELKQRIDFSKQRRALLARQLAAQGALEETLVLRFGAIAIDSPDSPSATTWSFDDPAGAPDHGRPRRRDLPPRVTPEY